MSAGKPNVERAFTKNCSGLTEFLQLPRLVLPLQHVSGAHVSDVLPSSRKSLERMQSIRNGGQQGVVGQLVKSHKSKGLLHTCWKLKQWMQVAILRFVVLIERERRHLQLYVCASVLDQSDVVRANLPVSRSLLPGRNKAGGENRCCRKECLCPGCPDFRLEARSADDPRAVGWVGHGSPLGLGSASCRAAGRQASARAQT